MILWRTDGNLGKNTSIILSFCENFMSNVKHTLIFFRENSDVPRLHFHNDIYAINLGFIVLFVNLFSIFCGMFMAF